MIYYAHSGKDRTQYSDYQLLRNHLRQVAELAKSLARQALPNHAHLAELARVAGLLHDLGKYRPGFQNHIRDIPAHRDSTFHKEAGAAKSRLCSPVSWAIAGHHGGLPDHVDLKCIVGEKRGQAHLAEVWAAAIEDCPELESLEIPSLNDIPVESREFLIRLVFSCLVDADWSDTAAYSRTIEGWAPQPQPGPLQANLWLNHVLAYIEEKARTCRDAGMGAIRQEILQACLEAAESLPGFFSLTVPTGGGKTLSALAFALKHAARHNLQRVIYVAPFLTILEQNAQVLRDALGLAPESLDLFEHHGLADPGVDDSLMELERKAAARRAETWDAPVIVTTNVQFFESLFSNRPGRCRKLHNIARSVILLDECQALPPGLVAPTCGMLRQVVSELGSTIVLCTATQPAFSHPELKADRLVPHEIIPPELNLFQRLQRVQLVWPTNRDERLDWEEIARRMIRTRAALCVVNTRQAARELFREMETQVESGACFHLSTSMCPRHRLQVLVEVRRRLATGERCYLVSTQLIEAGVDVDFPGVFREMGPLDGIIQAAGRCNREGLLKSHDGTPGGRVEIFRSKEGRMPREWYLAGSEIVENNFLAAGRPPRIDDPSDIHDYYTRLYYSGNIDQHGIRNLRNQASFKAVAEKYELIDQDGISVVVRTWESHREEVERIVAQVRSQPTRQNFRALRPFQVNLQPWIRVKEQGQVVQVDPRFDLYAWTGNYDAQIGLDGTASDTVLLV